MKKRFIILVSLLVVLILGSCDLGLFGPNRNKILQWVRDLEEGTKISYKVTEKETGYEEYVETFHGEILEIEERDTRTIVRLLIWGDTTYLIADDNRGELVLSFDDVIDEFDTVLLKTPVKEDTSWVSWDVYGISDASRMTVAATKQSHSAGAETVDDVVEIDVAIPAYLQDEEGFTVTRYEAYYSPSVSFLGFGFELEDTETGDKYSFDWVVTDISMP